MTVPNPDHDRLLELLADRALFGLTADADRELAKLLGSSTEFDADELDRLAAMVHLATNNDEVPLPDSLRKRLVQKGRELVIGQTRAIKRQSADHGRRREVLAWFAAAAAILLAVYLGSRIERNNVADLTPSELRSELERAPQDLTQVAWAPGTDETGRQATGEVLWNDARQQGVMSFQGLPVNDPQKFQYQLWIFDTAQDEKYPVDGGVFDIPPSGKEVLIPINAKLKIVDPTLFAITIEKPGGVVVSRRERLPLLAKVED